MMITIMMLMIFVQALDSLLAFMEPSVSMRNYTKQELLEAFCRDVDAFALELATGENSGDLLTAVEETIEEVAKQKRHKTLDIGLRYPWQLVSSKPLINCVEELS